MNGPILTSRSFMPSIMILTILPILRFPLFLHLRARAEINSHFGASAGRANARRRDEGDVGHRRGAATKPIRALAAAPLRAAARRLAGFVARSSHTAPGIARRSRLASGPGGLQQNVKLFLREP